MDVDVGWNMVKKTDRVIGIADHRLFYVSHHDRDLGHEKVSPDPIH